MCKKCINVLIIGRNNVGKSTLFNKLIEKKISITSKKKNTTNKNIIGINTNKKNQYIYIDTPGFNKFEEFNKTFYNIKNIILKKNYIFNINLIILIIEKKNFFYEKLIIKKINKKNIPLLILINKIDKIKKKELILPFIKKISLNIKYIYIIPTSIRKKKYIKKIQKIIDKYLIKSNHYFNKKKKTIYDNKFIFSEIIREKIFRLIGDEIPYNIYVKIYKIINLKKKISIYSFLYINKKQYFPILIGKLGNKIKNIINLSKKDIKKYIKYKKKIQLFIKIKNDKLK